MSEIHPHTPHPGAPSQWVPLGGAIGIGAVLIGLAIFLGACFGFQAAFMFSILPLIMGSAGFLITIIGGLRRHETSETAHLVGSLFINLFAIVGGFLEVAVWMRWPIFYDMLPTAEPAMLMLG